MKKIILVVSEFERACERQEVLFETFPGCEITTCMNEKEALLIIMSEEFDLGLIEIQSVGEDGANVGELIRTSGYDFPILMTGSFKSKKDFLKRLPRRSNMIFLPEPVSDQQIRGVLKKLSSLGGANQPQEPRYVTQEVVQVEKFGQKKIYKSQMINLSLSGARLEFIEKGSVHLSMGDFLRINFTVGKTKKTRRVNGQVVWSKKDPESGRHCIGLEFLRAS